MSATRRSEAPAALRRGAHRGDGVSIFSAARTAATAVHGWAQIRGRFGDLGPAAPRPTPSLPVARQGMFGTARHGSAGGQHGLRTAQPREAVGDDFLEIVEARLPAQQDADPFGVGHDLGWIARSTRC